MLRLIHTQTVQGALLVDDIDDGLPNKLTHRLGSTADPKAYKRDGYANEPKQAVYVPRTKPTDPAVAGYIDLKETQKVIQSAGGGKIAGLQARGLVSVVSFESGDLAAPAITTATRNVPAAGDLTIVGTGFLSVAPDITSVRAFGAGVGDITLTATQILAVPPGAVSATSIVIDSTLLPGLTAGDSVVVTADDSASALEVVV